MAAGVVEATEAVVVAETGVAAVVEAPAEAPVEAPVEAIAPPVASGLNSAQKFDCAASCVLCELDPCVLCEL